MERQLIKVAKELNIGMSSVVDFLSEKGFDVDSRPNAKISDTAYDALVKKFSDSKAEKLKADQIVIGTRPMTPRTGTPSVTTTPTITAPPVVERKPISPISISPIAPITGRTDEKPTIVEEKPKIDTAVIERPKINLGFNVSDKVTNIAPVKLEPPVVAAPTAKPVVISIAPRPEQAKVEPPKVESPKVTIPPIATQRPAPQKPAEQKPQQDRPQRSDQPKQGENRDRNNENRNRDNNNRNNDNRNNDNRNRNNDNRNNDNRNRDNNNRNNDNRNRDNNNRNNDNRNNENRNRNRPEKLPVSLPPKPVVEAPPVEPTPAAELIRAVAPELRGLKIKGKVDVDKFIEREREERERERKSRRERERERDKARRGTGTGSGTGENRTGEGRGERTGDNRGGGDNRGSGDNRGGNRDNRGGGDNRGGNRQQQGGGGENRNGNNQNTEGGNRQQQGGGGNNNNNNAGAGNRPRRRLPATPGSPQQGTGNNNNNNQNRGGGYNNNRSGDNRQGGGNRNNLPPQQPGEVNQAQIEAKIKETMARLAGGNRGRNNSVKLRREKRDRMREREEMRQAEKDGGKLQVAEFISVSDLASLMDVNATEVIKTCMKMGYFVNLNQRLDAELIDVIAGEFGHEVEFISAEEQVAIIEEEIDAPEDLLPRAPIVTVMGHVDHGKTSLLDYIRKANVVSGEAGGITQHIGAYEVKLADDRRITFLDTPGHEAFTAMRARGAKVTDVAVVIISADDSIMPQTREAISHAQAANVPMIFAINKIDKEGADPTRIKNELAQMNLLVEEWGGKYQSHDISAKKGIGIEEIMEKILLEADLLDLKANPNKRASGTIIEASLDKGRGYVAKMLVATGTLKIGDPLVSGENAGKVKAMFNERGQKVLKAGPSTPVLVLGLNGAPQAGETFKVMENESDAKEIANKRAQIVREQSARATKRISLEEIGRRLALGTFKELNLIIKGDVDGSVEALADSLLKQSHETVQVRVLHKAVGAITESDVTLASASDAIIIGFQVRPTINARKLAEREGVEIKNYSIIYEAIAEIRSAIEGMLEPTKEEKITSSIEVRQIFKISKIGTIAGCYVQEGKVERKHLLRVIRDGIVIFPVKEGQTGTLGSLKRVKDDVKEVKSGYECGLTIDNFNDIEVGDTIETYEIIEVKQKLAKL